MDGKVWPRILAGLVLLAALAGIAFFAYNAGVAAQLPAQPAAGAQPPVPYYYGYPYSHPFPFFSPFFGCFAALFGLFLIFLAFRAFSFMLWGPRWGRWGHRHHGWRQGSDEEGGVPPMFRDWHDRAHGQPPASAPENKSL
jgi:hypothetical protein